MNDFVPRGYLTLEKALEHFGQLKHAGEGKAEKASSKQEFRQFLFAGTLSAKLFTTGRLLSLESSIWGRTEAEYIFSSGWGTIHGGDEYFPSEVRGRVLIEQSSIDALFDGDYGDSSPSTKGAETKCKKWLITLMSDDGKPEKAKAAYKTEAQGKYSVGSKAFGRAWTDAIKETGNTTWSNPGRKS